MISLSSFFKCLDSNDINFYTGVPDSLLSELSKFIENQK